jgi:solute carrier family 10 (sodium/bile acid cotransporter), member 7
MVPKLDPFLAGLVLVVAASFIWPALGADSGPLHLNLVAVYGVSIAFFLYGLTLAPERMRAGLQRWKVHLLVQATTFLVFPLVVLAAGALLPPTVPREIVIGFFYLAALPSTVSSSVAMTSLARGNVPVAIFNASLSSLLAVFVTPAWMAWYLATTGIHVPLGPTIGKIVLLVLLPIALGQLVRIWLSGWAARNGRWVKPVDRIVILAIVYNSFCNSIVDGIWTRHSNLVIVEMIFGSLALFAIIYVATKLLARGFGLDRDDTIAAQFCGSKKSLAVGIPMAPVIFGSTPALGLLIAPTMLFHFLQLVIVSFIAQNFAREAAGRRLTATGSS